MLRIVLGTMNPADYSCGVDGGDGLRLLDLTSPANMVSIYGCSADSTFRVHHVAVDRPWTLDAAKTGLSFAITISH